MNDPRDPNRYYDSDLPDDDEQDADSEEQDIGACYDDDDDDDICGPLWSPQPRD